VRQGDWVALQENTTALDPNANPVELYNLKDDLAQENNLADQYPEKLEAMKALLAAAHSPNEHFAFGKKKNKK
jgi:arylsulfatase A-like enzyme